MPDTRISILCDDCSRSGFGCEHGLSLALDLEDGSRWLWDTGQSGLFLDNARTMGLDAANWTGVALSHGHFDHAGGLAALLGTGYAGPVYVHPGFAAGRWKFVPGAEPRRIGLDSTGVVRPVPGLRSVSGLAELGPHLAMLTDIPRRPGRFQSVAGYFFDLAQARPDPVADDACLLLRTARGPVLALGCCHSGLANTLEAVRERLGVDRLHALVGGLHLLAAPSWALAEAVQAIRGFAVERVYACHCTGQEALQYLERATPGTVRQVRAGDVLVL